MAIRLKICGMRNPENITQVIRYTPDYLGFIFYEPSPRFAGHHLDVIRTLHIPSAIRKVGVFVNEQIEKILEIHQMMTMDLIQLHGDEPVDTCRSLQDMGFKVIKVFAVGPGFNFNSMIPYVDCVDFFLLDTMGKFYGGNSESFDWSLIRKYPFKKPFFLGGGVGLDNIQAVPEVAHPFLHALDVNSKLESAPGIKDPVMVRKFREEFDKLKKI